MKERGIKLYPRASGVNHRGLEVPFTEIRNTGTEVVLGGETNTAIWVSGLEIKFWSSAQRCFLEQGEQTET